jgi:hypothetical protein
MGASNPVRSFEVTMTNFSGSAGPEKALLPVPDMACNGFAGGWIQTSERQVADNW